MEEFDKIDVRRMLAEMLFEDDVDRRFEHKGIINSYHANIRLAEPTRLSTTGMRGVHYIIRYEEESLKELSQPA